MQMITLLSSVELELCGAFMGRLLAPMNSPPPPPFLWLGNPSLAVVGQELVNVRVRHVDVIRVVTPVGVVLRRIDGQGDNVTPVKFIFYSKGILHYIRGVYV